MNFLIMLKNELEAQYLEESEKLIVIMKKASCKYPIEENPEEVSDLNQEVKILEKIMFS